MSNNEDYVVLSAQIKDALAEVIKTQVLNDSFEKIFKTQIMDKYDYYPLTDTKINYNGYTWNITASQEPDYSSVLEFLEEVFKAGTTKVYLSNEDIKALQYSPRRSDLIIAPHKSSALVGRYKGIVNIYADEEGHDG